jgi:peptidyl-prolyl cis-trans isomerase D
MTMLDRMRRHRNWLKWSLALVCLAFVVFYIPDFLSNPTTDLAATDNVAIVEGHEISGAEFRRVYQAQIQQYRAAYGNNLSEQLLRQLGIDQQILQQMVDERAAAAEAERLGIRVTDAEVRQRILLIPSFQENGVFIGEQRYQQLLMSQRPPMLPSEFEESVRRALVVEKLRAAITQWLSVPDRELESEYRRRNDKVKLAVISFPVETYRPDVSATDAETQAYFDSRKEEFRVPEKRKIRYLLVDVEAIRASTVVPPAEIDRAYNENFAQYTTPDEIRASHVLLRTEGKDEAQVRAQAEEILKQARAGADFAELAKKHSQDEGTAPSGGDLDFFGRGRMVPEFDAVAFALEPGQISDLVRTQFGFHIIKLTEKKPGTTQTLDEVRPQLTEQLAFELAQARAVDLAEQIDRQVTRPEDLDAAAKTHGLTVQESEFFARDEPISGLGAAPQVAAQVFELDQGQVTEALQTARGFVVAAVAGRQDPYLPEFDAVKERVRDVVLTQKATEMARQHATETAAKLKGASDFEAAAKRAGVTVETTELIARDAPLPGLGMVPEITDAAFQLPAGGVSDPIASERGAAIVKVLEKQETTAEQLASDRDRFREELLADRRSRFFSAYMVKAKQKMTIQVNREAVQRMVG